MAYNILTSTHGWIKFFSWVFMTVWFALSIAASVVTFGLTSAWSTFLSVLISAVVGIVVMYVGMAAIIIIFFGLLARELNQ